MQHSAGSDRGGSFRSPLRRLYRIPGMQPPYAPENYTVPLPCCQSFFSMGSYLLKCPALVEKSASAEVLGEPGSNALCGLPREERVGILTVPRGVSFQQCSWARKASKGILSACWYGPAVGVQR